MHLADWVVLNAEVFRCLIVSVSLWQTAFWRVAVRIKVRTLAVSGRKCNAVGYGRTWIGELLVL